MSSRLWLICGLVVLLISGLSMATGDMLASGHAADSTCLNLLANSNMESNSGWMFGPSPATGFYTTEQAFSPARSAQLGITSASNVNAYSSMRQTVLVSAGDQLRLRLQVLQLSQAPDPNDQQEIRILDAVTGATLRQVWSSLSNDGVWKGLQFDLSEFLGRSIVLYINVRNDGAGGKTAMFVDDVLLELCSSGGPTPTATPTAGFVTATPTDWVVTNTPTPPPFVTATPTAWVVTNTPTPGGPVTATPTLIVVTSTPTPGGPITATPTPTAATSTPTRAPATITPTYTPAPPPPSGCKECLVNTGFENWGSWYFAPTNLPAAYSGAQAHSGIRSAVLGNPNASAPNYVSYSSVRQKVVLPKGEIKTAFLDFWHYTASDLEGDDYQEAVILDANTGRTLEVLWRANSNDRSWQPEHFDLTRYLGRAIVIYFNVYNGGGSGRASMYIDDAQLSICGSIAPTPVPLAPADSPPVGSQSIQATPTSDMIEVTASGDPTPSVLIPTAIVELIGPPPLVESAIVVTQPSLLNCFLSLMIVAVFGLIIYALWWIFFGRYRLPPQGP